jgi:methionine sulfoxide reductase heme-binding subunit
MPPWRDRQGRFSALKAATLAGCMAPGTVVAFWLAIGWLGARPIHTALLWIGLWTVRFILLALTITPAAVVLDWPRVLIVRRMVGVTAAAYALAHLGLNLAVENFRVLHVASEIALRLYLTIGFVALLGLIALAATSTDRAVRRMGPNWKRLNRLAYPIGALALLHFFIQSKGSVNEPVIFSGLFVWLMLWRVLPAEWQRSGLVYAPLAVASTLTAAGIEYAWYDIATHINAARVLAANETLRFGLRPAHWVLIWTLIIGATGCGRRMMRERRRRVVVLWPA